LETFVDDKCQFVVIEPSYNVLMDFVQVLAVVASYQDENEEMEHHQQPSLDQNLCEEKVI
jgi:hypothetical protein